MYTSLKNMTALSWVNFNLKSVKFLFLLSIVESLNVVCEVMSLENSSSSI